MTQSVAMIGLGKLGMPVAECMASKYTVKGYDIVAKKSDKITICKDLYEAVHDVDIVFIAMPTPHDTEYGGEKPISKKIKKDFDYTALDHCLSEIETAYKKALLWWPYQLYCLALTENLQRNTTKLKTLCTIHI